MPRWGPASVPIHNHNRIPNRTRGLAGLFLESLFFGGPAAPHALRAAWTSVTGSPCPSTGKGPVTSQAPNFSPAEPAAAQWQESARGSLMARRSITCRPPFPGLHSRPERGVATHPTGPSPEAALRNEDGAAVVVVPSKGPTKLSVVNRRGHTIAILTGNPRQHRRSVPPSLGPALAQVFASKEGRNR